jgi:hypothetical protein
MPSPVGAQPRQTAPPATRPRFPHEDKISPQCDYELGEAAASVQASLDSLKDAIIACKAEITGVCGKTVPGQGRIAACLMANKSAASKGCVDAIQTIEAQAAQ